MYFNKLYHSKQKKATTGSAGSKDYTRHRDPVRKRMYLARHAPREDWTEPMTAGALSRWILWYKETLRESILDYTQWFDITLER